MSSNLVIDWEYLHRLSDGNEEFELELLNTFVQDTQLHLKTLETALIQQNAPQLEQEAHHIKGASANLGLTGMYAAASSLEDYAHQNQFQDTAPLLDELRLGLATIATFLAGKQAGENGEMA